MQNDFDHDNVEPYTHAHSLDEHAAWVCAIGLPSRISQVVSLSMQITLGENQTTKLYKFVYLFCMKNKIIKIMWDVDKLAWGNLIHISV